MEALGIVNVAFGLLGDLCHCGYSFDRIFAHCRLARKHDGAGAVVNGVGNVGYLGSCRARIVYHRLKHFCRGDHALSAEATGGYHHFLNCGELFKGNFNSHVAAGDHDAVAGVYDLLDVIDARAVFYLCDYVYVVAAVLVQEAAYILDVFFV